MSLRLTYDQGRTHWTTASLASSLALHTTLATRQTATRARIAFEFLARYGILAFHQGPEITLARKRLACDSLGGLTRRVGDFRSYHACQLRLSSYSLAR